MKKSPMKCISKEDKNLPIEEQKISKEWKNSIRIVIFKKRQKMHLENYRQIVLLDIILKKFTKILMQEMTKIIRIREYQKRFQKNWSTSNIIFVINKNTIIRFSIFTILYWIKHNKNLRISCFAMLRTLFLIRFLKIASKNYINTRARKLNMPINTKTQCLIRTKGLRFRL